MRTTMAALFGAAAGLLLPAALVPQPAPPPEASDSVLRHPPAADWLMWRRTYDGHGYSPLAAIDTLNVGTLALAWSRALGPGRNEMTPLVRRGVMYIPHPNDIIEAVDAATGVPFWIHRRELPDDLRRFSPLPDIKRNIAVYENLLISTSGDQHVYALDAIRGDMVWETRVRDYRLSGNQGSGPIVVDGLAISGRSCEPPGDADTCVITAHDARTGAEVWRTRTIPRVGEPGDESWGGLPEDRRLHVGAWMVPTYDPVIDLLYIGTSVTSPAPKFLLAGYDKGYLYHNSTLALDPRTGRIVWYYQHLVDEWDLDHTFERILVDTEVAPDPAHVRWIRPGLRAGETRRVVTGIPGKTGIIYTLDRGTGEFLWATPTVEQNIVASIDVGTGRVTTNPAVVFDSVGDERRICPSIRGGRQWDPGSYSPLAHAMYFPLTNTCGTLTAEPGGLYSLRAMLGDVSIPDGRTLGAIRAISVESGRPLWETDLRDAPGALLSTGGGLLFGGDQRGYFRAFSQRTGEVLWEVNLGAPVVGPPISFAVGERQYIAVSTGAKLHSAALLWLADGDRRWLMPDQPFGGTLYVFRRPRPASWPEGH